MRQKFDVAKDFWTAAFVVLSIFLPTYAASDSLIPYQFKDGQVISADTLNDLFSQIQGATSGFSSASNLVGDWSCTTFDSTPSASKTAGMPNSQFSLDGATGLEKISQTWTFSAGGTILTMDKVMLGGIPSNNTGGCSGVTAYQYSSKVVASTLMLTPITGCVGGGQVTSLTRVSPYQFRAIFGPTVVSCVANTQPPSIPTSLTATVSGNTVNLQWINSHVGGGGPTGFIVLKKINGAYSQLATTGPSDTSYTDSSGVAGDLYRVQSAGSIDSLPSIAAIAQ